MAADAGRRLPHGRQGQKMAALSSGKCASGGPERTKRSRGRGRAAGGAAASLLMQDEARCPVWRDVFAGLVTLPCRHSQCLACFRQKVERSSLRCPLCRLRVSGWARLQCRGQTLLDSGQWDRVRRSYPERCRRRMEQREGEAPVEGAAADATFAAL